MKITTVKYERLRSGPGYENERFGAEMEIGQGDNYLECTGWLKEFVNNQLGTSERLDTLKSKIDRAEARLNELLETQRKIKTAIREAVAEATYDPFADVDHLPDEIDR